MTYKNLIEIIAPLHQELFADLQQFQTEGRPTMSIFENLDQLVPSLLLKEGLQANQMHCDSLK